MSARVVVCMGVSATGKTSVAARLAEQLGWAFEEGDDHHPQANIDLMEAGTPLVDEDRWPWLEELARIAAASVEEGRDLVLTCSALKRSYRDVLRSRVPAGAMFFVHLAGAPDLLRARMQQRTKHFMPTSLLDDQLATLEPLGQDERGAVVDVAPSLEEVADAAYAAVIRGLEIEQSA
ncbi:gluconokinase [Nocardioidaceae bacterium]|nr:gluconokinase [Nocardioidaceae bacterium]